MGVLGREQPVAYIPVLPGARNVRLVGLFDVWAVLKNGSENPTIKERET
jgi:hypothetical protein